MTKFKRVLPSSRLTSKFQATIPALIRDKLDLKAGDTVAFDVKDGEVVLRKVSPLDLEYLRSLETTLSEWSSEHDEDAYRDL